MLVHFDYLPPLEQSFVDILHATFHLFMWPNVDILLTTYLPTPSCPSSYWMTPIKQNLTTGFFMSFVQVVNLKLFRHFCKSKQKQFHVPNLYKTRITTNNWSSNFGFNWRNSITKIISQPIRPFNSCFVSCLWQLLFEKLSSIVSKKNQT